MARSIDIHSYRDLNYRTIPFKAHVSLTASDVGKAVTVTSDFTVGLGSDGDPLIGRLEYFANSMATVATGESLIYNGVSGSLPDEKAHLVVNGAGAVRTATSADAGYGYSSKNIVVGVDATTFLVAVLS